MNHPQIAAFARLAKENTPPTRKEYRETLDTRRLAVDLGERRFLIIGMSVPGRILVVSHTETGDTIRIISARTATRRERRFYEEDDSSVD